MWARLSSIGSTGAGAGAGAGADAGAGAGAGAGLAQAPIKGSDANTNIRHTLPISANNFFCFIG